MSDRLTDAEVDNYFIDLARLPLTRDPKPRRVVWSWEWLKAFAGWVVDCGILKAAIALVTFAYFAFLIGLVVIGSAVADRLWMTCVYVLAMVVLVPLAIYEGGGKAR
jgi:hypothetical protein